MKIRLEHKYCNYKLNFFTVSHHVSKVGAYSRVKQELESKKQEFTYEEVLTITRNFEKVVGKGASGTIYHGWIDHETEVAVKMFF
ncbi:Leucine-rich repeat protein kinase family protein [Trifolium repens]|nr:Leucine-rich repeat protein kinase family protein [Trifolium repens]